MLQLALEVENFLFQCNNARSPPLLWCIIFVAMSGTVALLARARAGPSPCTPCRSWWWRMRWSNPNVSTIIYTTKIALRKTMLLGSCTPLCCTRWTKWSRQWSWQTEWVGIRHLDESKRKLKQVNESMNTQYGNGQCFIVTKSTDTYRGLSQRKVRRIMLRIVCQEKCKVQTTKWIWEIHEWKNEQLTLAKRFARVKFKIWLSLSGRMADAIQHK